MTNKRLKIIVYIIALAFIICALAVMLAACASEGSSSQTNNQTAGVDESDIVKVTDDGYILKAQTNGFTVSKADEGNIEVIVKEPYEEFTPIEMLVTDSLVVLFGNKRVPIPDSSAKMTKAEIKIYDAAMLKTGANGYLLRTSEFYGSFYTARLFDNKVYVLTKLSYANFYGDTDVNYFYDSYQSIKQFERIDTLDDESEQESIYSGFVVAKYNLESILTSSITATLYCGQNISDMYCSPYAIYAISGHIEASGFFGCGYNPRTGVSKVSKISLDDLSLKGGIEFEGSVLNRHSLYDNGLTFYAAVSGYNGEHNIYAYDRDLKQIGKSQAFARYETLYSVLFNDDLCYAVTFRQVDPLFKIDISDPTNIRILGELKIDGYSTHLQDFSDGTMIGLGFETNSWAQSTGVKLTLFDTRNDDPAEINSILFSESYGSNTYSPATSDPKAILCEPDNNIFAFPIQYKEKTDGSEIIRQGAIIFGIINGKLAQLAFLTNFDESVSAIDAAKTVMRITRIGNYLYTISDGYITSYSLMDFSMIGMFDTQI